MMPSNLISSHQATATARPNYQPRSTAKFGALSTRVRDDFSAASHKAPTALGGNFRLEVSNTLPVNEKTLATEQFNLLNKIEDKNELMDFVSKELKAIAEEYHIRLNDEKKITLETRSESGSPTRIEFICYGKNEISGNKECTRLIIGDADTREITPQLRTALNSTFNIEGGMLETTQKELKERDKEIAKLGSRNTSLQKQVETLNQEKLELQEDKVRLKTKIENHERKFKAVNGEMLNKVGLLDGTQAELRNLKIQYDKLTAKIANNENNLTLKQQELDTVSNELQRVQKDNKTLVENNAELQQHNTMLQAQAESVETTLSERTGDIKTQTAHLASLGRRSYKPAAILALITVIGAIVALCKTTTGLKSANDAVDEANNDLTAAADDKNYVEQGQNSGDTAVKNQADEDKNAYTAAKAGGDDKKAQEIADRYTKDSLGNPQFSPSNLTEEGNQFMYGTNDGKPDSNNQSLYAKNYQSGVADAKKIAVETAKTSLNSAKESVNRARDYIGITAGVTAGFLALSGLMAGHTKLKNSHIKKTESAINEALEKNSKFVEPKMNKLLQFTHSVNHTTINRFRQKTSKA